MTTLAIKGNPLGLGSMTLVSPNSSLSQTLTLPDSTGNVVVDVSTQTLTNKTLGSGTVTATSLITSGTAQASTSGVAIDFTGIPSWVKRITVMFNSVSVSSTNPAKVQIGAGSVDATGYLSASTTLGSTTLTTVNFTDGFTIRGLTSADVFSGSIVLKNISGNIWIADGILGNNSTTGMAITAGTKTLSGTLDRVRITINGTDTFDAGSINILYE